MKNKIGERKLIDNEWQKLEFTNNDPVLFVGYEDESRTELFRFSSSSPLFPNGRWDSESSGMRIAHEDISKWWTAYCIIREP